MKMMEGTTLYASKADSLPLLVKKGISCRQQHNNCSSNMC